MGRAGWGVQPPFLRHLGAESSRMSGVEVAAVLGLE